MFAMILAALLIFLLTGQMSIFQGTFHIYTFMEDSGGMSDNAAVRLNGIPVGHVAGVTLTGSRNPNQTVRIAMEIESKYLDDIPLDSKAAISASNLLGDKFINITRGVSPKHVEPGGDIASLQTQDIPELMAQSSNLLAQLQTIIGRVDGLLTIVENGQGNVGKLIKDDSLYNRLNATAAELEQLVNDVKNSNGTISHLLYDNTLYEDIRRPVERLDNMLEYVQQGKGNVGKAVYDTALYDEARASLAEAKQLLDNLNAGKGTAGKLLTDDELYRQLNLITEKVNLAMERINSGQGTIGQLMVNPSLYDSATAATKELQTFMADFRNNPKKFLRIRLALF